MKTQIVTLLALSVLLSGCPDTGVTTINAPPVGEITYPSASQQLTAGAISAIGVVEDPDGAVEVLEVSWLLDGQEACAQHPPSGDGISTCDVFLEAGTRTLTLQVRDQQGKSGSDAVSVEVSPYGDPWAEISSPESGGVYYSDQLVELAGVVGDQADAPSDLHVWWESSQDGELDADAEPDGSGNVLGSTYLSQGAHQLSLWVENTGLNTAYDSVTIEVGGSNSVPSCEILSPESGSEAQLGKAVSFTAAVEDPDIPEDWLSVRWSSDEDGDLGESKPDSSGEVLASFDELSVGVHVVTMTVSDEVGATCSDHITLTILDCSDLWYRDSDGDGYGDPSVGTTGCEAPSGYVDDATDCDDGDPAVHPEAAEVCNELDDDCDGAIDDADSSLDTTTASTWYLDGDGDGYGDASSVSLACEQPTGAVADATDCDDATAATHPGADEYCDGVDTDCDGALDEDDALDATTWHADADGDGFGDPLVTTQACAQPAGYVSGASDCDDATAATHPGADEYCDGVDTDCDGTLDEDDALDASTWYADDDGDGYGDPSNTHQACSAPSGHGADDADCDDTQPSVNPGADELCDGIDNDCDGSTDEDDAVDAATWYADVDGDSFGAPLSTAQSCSAPSGYVADDTDCDDAAAATHPGADEHCDGVDTDCDGVVDEDDALDASTWYVDADLDGYGSSLSSRTACSQPSGYLADSSDCDDSEAGINPAADEVCDGVDNDCDGAIDEASALDASTWYLDSDGDGYGIAASSTIACSQPSGYAANDTDCDDNDPDIWPGAAEIVADGVDQDCDGGDSCYEDLDGDGYGSGEIIASSDLDCDDAGESSVGGDGDDDDGGTYPGAPEIVADGIDQDCDGGDTCYEDRDGDGFGTTSTVSSADLDCADLGESATSDDCDDDDPDAWPGATETVADGVDQDCDGAEICFADGDGDGYGSSSTTASSDTDCSDSGESTSSDDCDDGSASVHPGAAETVADGVDQDCDGGDTCFEDLDGDGYGGGSTVASLDLSCSSSGQASSSDDCDDGDAGVNPAATEVCGNGVDDDCDGTASGCLPCGEIGAGSADVKLTAEGSYDSVGESISGGGDINGDGYDDLLVGAPYEDGVDWQYGAAYIVYGPASSGSLAGADAKLAGNQYEARAGLEVAIVGDTNADGYDDIIVQSAGSHFLYRGPISSLTISSSTSDAYFNSSSGEVSGADLNGDGYSDLFFGDDDDDTSYVDTGTVYLVWGPESGGRTVSSSYDARFYGERGGDNVGHVAPVTGDLNGDGHADLIIGAPHADSASYDSNVGVTYVINGPSFSGSQCLSGADARLYGVSTWDEAGSSVDAEDVDGDGYDDLLIGSEYGSCAYLVLGPVSGDSTLSTYDAKLTGSSSGSSGERAGEQLAFVGDVDGDGWEDVLIGAKNNDDAASNAGAAYLVLGPFSGTQALSDADARILGEADTDFFGEQVVGAGDVDGDGYDDIFIGAHGADSSDGAAYLFYGGGI